MPGRIATKTVNSLPPAEPHFEIAFNHTLINIRNLKKGYRTGPPLYKTVPVIKNLNFDFYDNQIPTLLGFNGAGKSTLIDLITGKSENF